MIHRYKIDDMVETLKKAGVNVYKEDYVIVAGKGAKFDEDVYPLEIVVDERCPDDAVFVTKRPESTQVVTGGLKIPPIRPLPNPTGPIPGKSV